MSFRFRLGGCQVRVGFSCLALAAFACQSAGYRCLPLLLTVLCHEGGHLLALWAVGAAPRQVVLSALGCRMILPPGARLAGWQAVLVSLAGPGANLLCCLPFLLMGRAGSAFGMGSLALGLLHLLPIQPLDGGLALRRLLEEAMAPARAERASRWVSAACVLPLFLLGFTILLRTRYNFTLLALSTYLMLYLVLGQDQAY